MPLEVSYSQHSLLLFTHQLYGGGAERDTARLANAFATAGWPVRVVTMEPISAHDYPLHPKVQRQSLSRQRGGLGRAQTIMRFCRLWLLLRRSPPQVAIGVMCINGLILQLLRPRGCAVVTYEASNPRHSVSSQLWRLARTHLLPRCAAVIAQTAGAAAALEHLVPGVRCRVIANALNDLPDPSQGELMQAVACKPYALCVGRLQAVKRFSHAIEAFARIADRCPQWQLVIIGDGELRSTLHHLSEQLQLSQRIHLLPFTSGIAAWYQHAGVLLSSSRYEGLPNVLLEAMQHALPIVAYDYEFGPQALLGEDHQGCLVPMDDGVAGLATALHRILNDPDLRQRLGQRHQLRCQDFSPDRQQRRWLCLVNSLLR